MFGLVKQKPKVVQLMFVTACIVEKSVLFTMADQQKVPARELYAEIEPYDTGFLKVSDLHEIYYEQCGNASGKPVLYV